MFSEEPVVKLAKSVTEKIDIVDRRSPVLQLYLKCEFQFHFIVYPVFGENS